MAKKRNGILLATLAAGAYAYFSKKENRDKAQVAVNNVVTKVDSFVQSKKADYNDQTKTGLSDPYDFQDNKMVDEGAQTSVQYYNREVEDKSLNSNKDSLYKKQEDKEITDKLDSINQESDSDKK